MRCAHNSAFTFAYIVVAIMISYFLGAFVNYCAKSFWMGWFVSCSVYGVAAWEWIESQAMEANLCEGDPEL